MTDYFLKERINIWRGKSFANQTMQDIFTFNAFETVTNVNEPVYFFRANMIILAAMSCKIGY